MTSDNFDRVIAKMRGEHAKRVLRAGLSRGHWALIELMRQEEDDIRLGIEPSQLMEVFRAMLRAARAEWGKLEGGPMKDLPGKYVCRYCGSDELVFPADVVWDIETQDWKLVNAAEGKPRCNGDCEGEQTNWAKFIPLE